MEAVSKVVLFFRLPCFVHKLVDRGDKVDGVDKGAATLLDIFHATPQSSQRLIPIAFDNQCVASVAALRETKMSGGVGCGPCLMYFLIDDYMMDDC
jgi:hypothetical protein